MEAISSSAIFCTATCTWAIRCAFSASFRAAWKTAASEAPGIGVRADIASGDEDPHNQDLPSFTPLCPKGAYFSEAGLIGPVNFIDLNPCIDLHPAQHATLILDWDF